jgi:hypothetical protein
MNKIICLITLCAVTALCGASAAPATSDSGYQLTIELRDGSRVVGKTVEDTLSFHSGALGDMKLSWSGIRAIEYAADSGTARLTATNGDGFSVQFTADTMAVETGFGKTELPVKLIRSIKVTPPKLNVPTAPVAAAETGSRLTIELRDGSHVVGKGLDDTLGFHSTAMGDLTLNWAGIRSIEYATADTDTARLTATNGDVYEVQFTAPAVRVETSFGKNELPVKLIRSIKVSAMTPAASGLVGSWSGEGDGKDSAGGNDATLTDVSFADGKVGRAFSLNGTSSGIKVPASAALDVGTGDGFTVMAWIKPFNLAEQQRNPIFEWNNGDSSQTKTWGVHLCMMRPYENGLGAGNLWASVHDTDGQEHLISARGGTLAANIFQHVALSYDKVSGIARLFCNGTIVAEQNLGHFTPQTSYDFYIGQRPAGDVSCSFSGLMDEVGIYNRALSAAEIQDICREQNNGELPPPNPARPPYQRMGSF